MSARSPHNCKLIQFAENLLVSLASVQESLFFTDGVHAGKILENEQESANSVTHYATLRHKCRSAGLTFVTDVALTVSGAR
jgi:hypothetical protein